MDSFLRALDETELSASAPTSLKRATASHTDESAKFRLTAGRRHNLQYSNLYFCRLAQLMPIMQRRIEEKWPGTRVASQIANIAPDERAVVVGTLYKDMKLKPAVLKQYLEELTTEMPTETYLSDTDFLCIEDNSSRLTVMSGGPVNIRKAVTGLTIAALGTLNSSGLFSIEDWTLAEVPPAIPRPLEVQEDSEGQPIVAFVSGLRLGQPTSSALGLLALRDFMTGASGPLELSARIARLVVVGDTLPTLTDKTAPDANINAEAILDECDVFFASIAHSVPVDLMPGPSDPTTYSLPQQPIHPALFPQCRRFANFRSTPNPYSFTLDGIRVMATSGQAVEDILNYTDYNDELDALELSARSRCVAPTAPDTLPCYPYSTEDPFVMAEPPHLLLSGCASKFGLRVLGQEKDGMRIITVPDFSKTGELILFSLRDLKAITMKFDA